MPLEIRCASDELRAICLRRATAEQTLGKVAARKLRARLSDIRAATDIRQVVLGHPSSPERGKIVFLLSAAHRLVVVAFEPPIPRHPTKQVDWAIVSIIEVVEIS